MLIDLHALVAKYNITFTGVLHVGAHECEEISYYERYLQRNKILWIEALADKVEWCKIRYPDILIENAVVSDKVEPAIFHRANNDQSSSILELGVHRVHHPHIYYTNSFIVQTQLLGDILAKYPTLKPNFLNLDIQGAELKALKGMETYLGDVEYIYTEVNCDSVYLNCAQVTELDEYLAKWGFTRVETSWCENYKWGDALYIKNNSQTKSAE
jgi:FkbM family methyltransferase